MLYVQLDQVVAGATRRCASPPGTVLALRARRLDDVLDGLELRSAEPAILIARYALAFALGADAVAASTWRARGLDVARGFAVTVGERGKDGRWPLGLAAFAATPALGRWLGERAIATRAVADTDSGTDSDTDGTLLVAGDGSAGRAALDCARAPWQETLGSDDPYLELTARFGPLVDDRRLGGLWIAACRRGARFQVEMVAELPGLPPLHVIARDPPLGVAEIVPPDRAPPLRIGAAAAAPVAQTGQVTPPSWDEPGPCDCGVPADECAMRRFRLTPSTGAPESSLAGADNFRQLSASLVDLHRVAASRIDGVLAGDRVLCARSPESFGALSAGDAVLDDAGTARPLGAGEPRDAVVGAILSVLPWPQVAATGALRRTFSGLW